MRGWCPDAVEPVTVVPQKEDCKRVHGALHVGPWRQHLLTLPLMPVSLLGGSPSPRCCRHEPTKTSRSAPTARSWSCVCSRASSQLPRPPLMPSGPAAPPMPPQQGPAPLVAARLRAGHEHEVLTSGAPAAPHSQWLLHSGLAWQRATNDQGWACCRPIAL